MKKNSHGGDIYSQKIDLDFSININPLGTPKAIILAMQKCISEISSYPDYNSAKLLNAISKFHKIENSKILLGNGASELIYAFANLNKIRSGCVIEPTFSEYCDSLTSFDKSLTHFLPSNIFELQESDFDKLPKVDAYYLCNPNNPTGTVYSKKFVEKLLTYVKKLGGILFVDECFMDFADENQSVCDLVNDNSNLVILRAFTKSYAIAGVRLGYMLTSNCEILSEMERKMPPWHISSIAQVCGVTALEQCSDLSQMRQVVKTEREFLIESLTDLGFVVTPSKANFVLFKANFDLKQMLIDKQILIRDGSNFFGLERFCFRICVKSHNENVILIKKIKEIILCQQNQ